MCNKIPHKTTYGAAAHILYLEKKNKVKKGVKKMGSYWCEECQAYHITTKVRSGCIFFKNIKK